MANILTALDGVSRFFQWLYVGTVSIWNTFSLVVILLLFIGLQIGFIYVYYKAGSFILNLYPQIQRIMNRIDRFFE